MDEIEQRLKDTSEACFSHFEAWLKDKKNVETREALQDSIHELRKVASRLEIELAISDRDEKARKPIPIPSHRDANRRHAGDGQSNSDNNSPKGGRTRKVSLNSRGSNKGGNKSDNKGKDDSAPKKSSDDN